MKKQITKLTKNEKTKIENRLLSVFAVALGGIMLLTYVYNYLNGSKGFRTAAEIMVYVATVAFIALAVFLKVRENKAKKENQLEKANKYKNWFWTSIAAAIVSFITYPDSLIRAILPQDAYNHFIVNDWSRFIWFGNDGTDTRIIILMALIALYVIAVFIYYGVYLAKAHKASLNKGSKKK